MNSAKLAEFVELNRRRRALEAELDEVKGKLADLQSALLDDFGDAGISSVKAQGATVFIKRELWASPADGDYQRASYALINAGLGHFVQPRFNTNTLSAYFRELEKDGQPIPEALKETFNLTEKFSLQIRMTSKGD
jgi:hypothetical protein